MSECDDIERIIVRLPAPVQVTIRERVGIPGAELEVRVFNHVLQSKRTNQETWTDLYDFSQPIRGGRFGPLE